MVISLFVANLKQTENIETFIQSVGMQRVKARMGEISTAPDLRPQRQQARLEAFWLEEGAYEAKGWFSTLVTCESVSHVTCESVYVKVRHVGVCHMSHVRVCMLRFDM